MSNGRQMQPGAQPRKDPRSQPGLLAGPKRLDPASAKEYRRQGRLFFAAALFFCFSSIILLGLMAMNKEPSHLVVTISIVAMVMSGAASVFGVVRLCQAVGANKGCAAVLAILVFGTLLAGMIYQVIWYFLVRKPPGGPAP